MAPLNRRRTLALLGGAGAAILGARIGGRDVDAATCVNLAGAQTEGPYWVEENLNRSDIRIDPADGSIRPGTLLNLTINVQNLAAGSCTALTGARVDIWHCDAGGTYSDEAANSSTGHKYLRGYQTTDDTERAVHNHLSWLVQRTHRTHSRSHTDLLGSALIGEFVDQIFLTIASPIPCSHRRRTIRAGREIRATPKTWCSRGRTMAPWSMPR